MNNPELGTRVEDAKQRVQAARARTQACGEKSQRLIRKALALLAKYDELEQRARRKFDKQIALRPQPAHKRAHRDELSMLLAMNNALASVENTVLKPSDGTAFRKLKSDLLNAAAVLRFRRDGRSNHPPRNQ
jgi:hypothetical protein